MARLSEKLGPHGPSGWSTRTTGRKTSEFNERRLQPVSAPIRSRPSGGAGISPPIVRSVQAFLRETAEEVGADEHPYKLLKASWSAWARERELAPLSDKVLGQALVEAGCRKRVVDKRRSGGGTFVAYSIPDVAA